jgi:tRNA(Ile)-lysidine synthase TilS/MesJ
LSDRGAQGLRGAAHERAVAFTQARRLVRPGDKVLVATGGGARSLALMNFLYSARDELDLSELAVAAVEPHTSEESDAAEVVADVGRLARSFGIDFYAVRPSPTRGRIDVQSELGLLALEKGFHRVALGNTRDDDAVRVLCELARGGIAAVRGLAPRLRGGFVRPFLVLSDAEAMAFTPGEAVGWGPGVCVVAPEEEAVRREVLPRLRAHFPGVEMMLQETGRRARARRRSPRAKRALGGG